MSTVSRKFENLTENQWRIIILTISVLILLFSLYSFLIGVTTVFPNLYYFPVILLAYRYHNKGVLYSAVLGLVYLTMALYFQYSNIPEIIGAFLRFISFIAVAIVIAFLSANLERKQLAYRSISEFNEGIISNANVWLAVLDSKGTILVWNKAAEEISGYSADEVIGKNTIWKLIYPDPDYRKKISRTITTIIRENRYFQNFDTTIQAKNSERKTISWNTRSIIDENGILNRYVAIGIDITKRQQAEKALAESEQRFRRTFDTAKDGLLLLDKDTGKISRVNPAITEMLGYPEGELIGKSLHEIGLLKDYGEVLNLREILNETGFVFFADVMVESRDGKHLDTEVYLVDRATQVQCNVRDITRRKLAEKQLLRRNEELFAANEQLAAAEEELRHNYDELFRSRQALETAHKKLNVLNFVTFTDIQNAIFSLYGFIELEKKISGDEEKQQYHDKQIGIVRTIAESLKFAGQYQNLGLQSPAWQGVMPTFLMGISHLDISALSRKLDVEGLEIYADPLLETVFYTLAENVILHDKTATEIRLFYQKSAGGLVLIFENNGAGIPEDRKEKIFERRNEEKKGLGLFLAREILGITGMTIKETGETGNGARFEITIPDGTYRFTADHKISLK
jgi:PAS domain S-box-containing protein